MGGTHDAMNAGLLRGGLAAVLAAVLLGACASTQLDAQWADPQLEPGALRGARVLVACDAPDAALRLACGEQLAAEVVARGATPVMPPEGVGATGDGTDTDQRYLQAARAAGAEAVLAQRISPYGSAVSPGVTVGLGGFGFGGGGWGAGVGVSAPIGGGHVTTGYAASARLFDVPSGRLLWSARASSPPSQDVQGQLRELARTVFEAADRSGVF